MAPSFKHARLLVIGSETALAQGLVPSLRKFGFHRIDTSSDFANVVALRDTVRPDIVLCDARGMGGESPAVSNQLLVELEAGGAAVLVLGSGPVVGASDAAEFLEEPFGDDDLLLRLTRLLTAQYATFEADARRQIMEAKNRVLRSQFEQLRFREMYARSLAFDEAIRREGPDRVERVVALLACEFEVRAPTTAADRSPEAAMPRLPLGDGPVVALLKTLPAEERARIKLHPIIRAWLQRQ